MGLTALLAGCTSASGLNGPAWSTGEPPVGPCYEADLSDGIGGADEIGLLFGCLNQHGAFREVEPLVRYLLSSDRVDAFVGTLSGLFADFDIPAALELTARVLTSEDLPVDGVLDLYVETYDDGLLPVLLPVMLEATSTMDACEHGADPVSCSVPRLLQRALASDVLDRVEGALAGLERLPDDPTAPSLVEVAADLWIDLSPRTNPDRVRNPLLELGVFLLEPGDGQSPLDELREVVEPLLHNRPLIDDLVAEVAALQRTGKLQALPDDVRVLFTHDVYGRSVGFEGDTIVNELLDVLGALDVGLLTDPICNDLLGTGSGPDCEPTTLLDVALELAEDMYQDQADVGEIVAELEDLADLLCGDEAESELCALMDDVLGPLAAAVEQTTFVPAVVLPLVHVLGVHVDDFEPLLGLVERVIAWDLLTRAEPLLRFTVERDLLTRLVDVVPAFVHESFGTLRPAGEDALEIVLWLFARSGEREEFPAPIDVLLPLVETMLSPTRPAADLDRLLAELVVRLDDPESAFSLDHLGELLDGLQAAAEIESIDLIGLVQELLDDEPLWTSGLHLLADPELIERLQPDPAGGDTTWWLRDLIERQVVDRLLTFTSTVLKGLQNLGLLDR